MVFTQSPYMFPLFPFICLRNTTASPDWACLVVQDVNPEGREICLHFTFALALPRCSRTALRCELWIMAHSVREVSQWWWWMHGGADQFASQWLGSREQWILKGKIAWRTCHQKGTTSYSHYIPVMPSIMFRSIQGFLHSFYQSPDDPLISENSLVDTY